MEEHTSYKNLVVGLPSSGKTTYMAALWNVVRDKDVSGALGLARLDGDDEYLNRIRTEWVRCEQVQRTARTAENYPRIHLVDEERRESSLVMPDLSGEVFEDCFSHRVWPPTLDSFAKSASGILLFIHPDDVREPWRIDQVGVQLEGDRPEGDVTHTADEGLMWDMRLTPTQVKLVDLLQIVVARRAGIESDLRVAVILSAWDLVTAEVASPVEWLAKHLPLVDQWLTANHEVVTSRIYGISAQGGHLPDKRDALLKKRKPSDRIVVIGEEAGLHDVTAPIRWLMGARSGD